MVARLTDLHAPRLPDPAPTSGSRSAPEHPVRLGLRGQLLLERATALKGVRAGGRCLATFPGVPLRIEDELCHSRPDSFIRDRMFAVIADDGSLCVRLPEPIAEDLIENGLCLRSGKLLLTWPIENTNQFELAWQILLHTYWRATGTPEKRYRRMWSEFAVQQ